MKLSKRIAALLTCFLLIASLTCVAGAAKESYTYRVTFRAGAKGTFSGEGLTVQGSGYKINRTSDTITITGLRQGDRVRWDNDEVVLNGDSRYYVWGVRLSGRDNDTVDATSFVVKGDRDYVVAYGIRGETVAYKVRFTDTNGKDLRKSRTMHGNVGDKPVVASLYIEGYLPQAYNLTGTLKADESKNVFTFVYRKVTAAESTETGNNNNNTGNTGTNNTGNNNNGNTGTAGNAGTNNNGNTDGAGTTGDTQTQTERDNQSTAQGGEENGNTTAPEEVPEIIDIDDEESLEVAATAPTAPVAPAEEVTIAPAEVEETPEVVAPRKSEPAKENLAAFKMEMPSSDPAPEEPRKPRAPKLGTLIGGDLFDPQDMRMAVAKQRSEEAKKQVVEQTLF
jgi:hypothetical protein